jgi:hypothetical protein
MSTDNSHARFADDWLALREPLDHQARSAALTALAARWLGTQGDTHRIVDLGSGRGSNLRYLAPRLPGPQAWRLLDHDPALLEQALADTCGITDADNGPVDRQSETIDLNGGQLEPALAGARLVTAAALFDLVTETWIDRLADACAQRQAAVLFVLSVDGAIDFLPGDTDDDFVTALLRAHQQRDKSFGAALGIEAPAVLARCFEHRGYTVRSEDSPWYIDRASAELGAALIAGWRQAACEQAPQEKARIQAWAERRTQALRAGELAITVGHRDLFACPGD